MNINHKEFQTIYPLNPPNGGDYSFRKGYPIVQFQVASSNKLLDGASLRLNGTLTVRSQDDDMPTNTTPVGPSVNATTGIALNSRVGVQSCIHQITTSVGSTNQSLETIRSYGRFLASTIPVTHSQGDLDTNQQQGNPASSSRSFQSARAVNVPLSFSIPLRTGLFSGGNLLPLSVNGVNGLNINLELSPDNNVISGYTTFDLAGDAQQVLFTPIQSGAYYTLSNLSLSYNLFVPDEQGISQLSIPSTGQLTYNSFSQLYSVINSSDSTKVFNLGTSRTKSVFHNFIPTGDINNYSANGFATNRLKNSDGSTANLNRVNFNRGGVKYPLDYDIDCRTTGVNGRPQTGVLTRFVDSIKPYNKFNHSLMSLYTQSGIPDQLSFQLDATPRPQSKLPDRDEDVFGVGIAFDNFSRVGVDFKGTTYSVRLRSALQGDHPNSIFSYVMSANTLTYSPNGISVSN